MSLKQKIAALTTAAIALVVITYFEGVRYKPYRDVAGVLTVCCGHRQRHYSGKEIHKNVMGYYKTILLTTTKSMH